MKKILFVTYGGGHAHMVYPVVRALRERAPGLSIDILGLPAALSILRSRGLPALSFLDFLDPASDADALAWGRELARTHHSPTIGASLEESVAYLGLSYKDLVLRHGERGAAALFAEKGRHAFLPVSILERVLDRLRPDAVVTTNSPRAEAAAIEAGNGRGLLTLIMADLFTGLGDYRLRAKHITFLNEVAKDMFLADGLVDPSLSRFHFTGNPAFDRLLDLPQAKDPAWVKSFFPDAGSRKLLLHADMPAYWDPVRKTSHAKTESETLAELEAGYRAAVESGAAYLLRPHPSQDRAFYARWVQGRTGAFLAAEVDLHSLLRNVDLVVARTTTVALEAVYLRKRVLQIDAGFHADFPLAGMGVAWGADSLAELPRAAKQALTDDAAFDKILGQIERKLPREPAAPKIAALLLACEAR